MSAQSPTGATETAPTFELSLKAAPDEEIALGGTIVYAVLVDGRRVGWVGDERPWRGHRYGQRQWWACWREDDDSAARWNSFDAPVMRSRKAALTALTEQIEAAR
jgi:hypothetical protein